jgi:glyoxylase-like metal-dependent hydrolase (beta-lactamase superfamily II)
VSVEIVPSYEPESGTWTYLLGDPVQQVAVIIDPVWVFDPVSGRVSTQLIDALLQVAQQRNYRIEWVLETHAHADHLSSAGYIRDRTGARIAIGRAICSVQKTFTRVFNLKDVPTDGSQFDRLLDDGDTLAGRSCHRHSGAYG